jgi:hypothetical protein
VKIEKYLPADILKPFVKTFMIVESEYGTENKILPDTSIVMAFRFNGRLILSRTSNLLPCRRRRFSLNLPHTGKSMIFYNRRSTRTR